MSHIHNIAGQSNAAAEYQAYLEALRAAREARENDRAQKDSAVETFNGYIDADEESDQEPPPDAEDAPEDAPGAEAAADADDTPAEGLGKHYA
jgi:hypothetical protein